MTAASSAKLSRLTREHLILIITGMAVLLALLFAGHYVVRKHLWAQQKIADLEPRYERVAGILRARDELKTAQAEATAWLGEFTYPASRELGQVAADAQQKVTSAFNRAGVSVISSQVMQESEEGALVLVPVSVRAEGDMDGLRKALSAVADSRPAIRLESLSIQRGRKPDAHTAVRLNVQATFVVWRRAAS